MQFCTVSLQNWCKRSVFTRSTGCYFEPVATGFYRSGSERFSFFRRLELQLKVQSFPVQSGLSPVFFRSYRPDFKTLLSARDLYRISNQLSLVLNTPEQSFGGLNMVFSGDFAQLLPAVGGEHVSLYSRSIGSIATSKKSQEESIG